MREIGVYCELWAWDVTEEQIRQFNPDGIILSGGPESTTEENSHVHQNMYLMQACLYWVFVTACKPWRCNIGGLTETSDHREFGLCLRFNG